jgi:hypothetical protein
MAGCGGKTRTPAGRQHRSPPAAVGAQREDQAAAARDARRPANAVTTGEATPQSNSSTVLQHRPETGQPVCGAAGIRSPVASVFDRRAAERHTGFTHHECGVGAVCRREGRWSAISTEVMVVGDRAGPLLRRSRGEDGHTGPDGCAVVLGARGGRCASRCGQAADKCGCSGSAIVTVPQRRPAAHNKKTNALYVNFQSVGVNLGRNPHQGPVALLRNSELAGRSNESQREPGNKMGNRSASKAADGCRV